MMTVKYLIIYFVACALAVSNDAAVENHSHSVYRTVESIQSQGYHVEIHHVTTDDGYVLQMHRMPYTRYQHYSNEINRPVVFLIHGLMSASNSFIVLGSEYSIGYNLADAGFDVWMGNARGNRYSRNHVSLDPDHEQEKFEFFDFSFEEIGMYDVASMIDYILDYTGMDKLHYIGHSQGGTVFLVLASMRPEYNEKLQSVHLLAAVGYMEYFPDSELSSVAVFSDLIYAMGVGMGLVELFPPSTMYMTVQNQRKSDYCLGDIHYKYICELIGIQQITRNNIIEDLFGDNGSAGASLKQIAHYGQNIRDKLFRRWSYGIRENLEVYGTSNPPVYDLGLITANVTMHYTVNDNLLDERDVLAMANDMPNTIVRKVARESFLHEDFVIAIDAKELVTDYIIEDIRRASSTDTDAVIIEETIQEPDVAVSESTNSASILVLNHFLIMFLSISFISSVIIKN